MNKRGPLISFAGSFLIMISFVVAVSAVPADVPNSESLLISSLFEGMFDDVSEPFQIMPGNMVYTSFSTFISDVPVLWGIQILDYQNGDKLSITISNIFGDSYGEYVQSDSVYFETIFVEQSDTLNFEIENIGTGTVDVIIMFSEDPENSDGISNTNSSMMDMVLPLMISGFLIIIGTIILIIGIIFTIFDLKNKLENKRNY